MAANQFQLTPETPELAGIRVLVVGQRPPISANLIRLGIPFAVWHDGPTKRPPPCLDWCSDAFPSSGKDIRGFVDQRLAGLGPFTHVIAGTERSVYVASVCRRALNARRSKHSIALRCSDKMKMKSLMRTSGIPVTDFLAQTDSPSPQSVFDQLGPRVVVKRRRSSGGRGMSTATCPQEIESRKERGLMYERFVDANEMSIESFVRDGKIQFMNTTNYLVKTHANVVPANLPAEVIEQARQINRQVIQALHLNWGLTHAEFYWSDDSVLFGEVALRPPGGYIMDCMSLAYGFDSWEAFVANELDLPFTFVNNGNRIAGVAMLHAGQGIVAAIENEGAAAELPTCVRFKMLVKPGDCVSERTGVSEVSAYGLFVSDSVQATRSDMLEFLNAIRFRMEPG